MVRTLRRICTQFGYPKMTRVDNSSEFTSQGMDLWAYADVTLNFSRLLAARKADGQRLHRSV